MSEKSFQHRKDGMDFQTSSDFLRHQVTHSGGKPPKSIESREVFLIGNKSCKCDHS